MRDLSFYNELLQNEDRRHRNQLNVIDSQLEAIKPWVQLSKKASKIAYDLGEKRNEKAQADHQIKILTADEWDPSVINKHNKQKRDFKLADNNLNNEIIGLKKEGYGPTLINYLKSLRGGAKIGAAEGAAERIADNYPSYIDAQLAENDSLFIDQTAEGGRRFAVNDVQTESELREAVSVLRKEYWEKSGLTGINTLIVKDKAWKKIKTAESNLIKAKQKQDSILQGLKETDEAIVRFKSDGDYVALLTSIATTDDENGKARSWTDARKIALTTIQKMADDPTITEERLDDIIEGIAKQSPSHMKDTYGEFNPGFIEELKLINKDAWDKIREQEDDDRDKLYGSLKDEWEDFAKENEITEANKKSMSEQVLTMTGRKATFLQDYETRQDTNDDQARENLTELKRIRPGNALYESDLLPYSNKIYREYISQVKESENLRDFDTDYSEKIDDYIDKMITTSRGLNWFNKGGDLEFEMKDIMEADIDSMKRDLLTQYTPAQAYRQIKEHIRAKIKNKDDKNEYLDEAKLAIKDTFDKGTTREFRKDLSRAMGALASNPSLYNSLVVVDKEYLDAAEKYRDTSQEGDPVPEIFSMIAKEFPTLEPFDIMNGQLEAAGLKPVEKPKIEQDIDKAPDNLLRTLRCQPTQTGLARCYVEVQRLKGEDKDGYQMDWSNPEFLTPGLEMTGTFPLPAGEKLIK